ncbi:MAG: short-chain dehydrogenase [Coxiella sp. RIFCSPHIGHO2_12_FULL_44_14]|nr:MAG: short-chain dehydrogenase [Coxiella sp. RIFCSPHIGHO2_12_FULL_44_14]
MKVFQNKTVLVTGAAGAIGQALCQHFLQGGAKVIALDCQRESLQQFINTVKGMLIFPVTADITRVEEVKKAIHSVIPQSGAVDILINNAGASDNPTLKKMNIAAWHREIDLNLSGAFHCVEAVRDNMMANRSGVIINISSVNALAAFGNPAYSAAKAGLISYTQALAMELGPYGIRANAICPGTVRTPAWEARVKKNPHLFTELIKWYPLQRLAEPDDIAAAVSFLASPQARVISGVVLPVDAGLMAGNRLFARALTLEEF